MTGRNMHPGRVVPASALITTVTFRCGKRAQECAWVRFGRQVALWKRISTPYTFAYRLLPFLFCGFLWFLLVLLLINGALQKLPCFLSCRADRLVFGYYSGGRRAVGFLLDEVDDCGDYLLVKKHGEEDTVLLSDIINVNFSTARDGAKARITLTLASPGKFGTGLSSATPTHLPKFSPQE